MGNLLTLAPGASVPCRPLRSQEGGTWTLPVHVPVRDMVQDNNVWEPYPQSPLNLSITQGRLS